ncbi:hypothetical protein JAAARDRAFT_322306 [Jaapia argillacea MUCL 33604]|uniref:Uncharacterized protein n=1 Tax=Jaapia argillacea MUCL 33604 TaxID=933084 RepID=A0A067PMZ3_9AGAM|nr:hypothetical protein JAAARDRAFT_322306 [Jaapia argillacea MUCL 33604]
MALLPQHRSHPITKIHRLYVTRLKGRPQVRIHELVQCSSKVLKTYQLDWMRQRLCKRLAEIAVHGAKARSALRGSWITVFVSSSSFVWNPQPWVFWHYRPTWTCQLVMGPMRRQ